MLDRDFLGWDRPVLDAAADWLIARRDELPHWLVIVPTSHSGRRLREALAERAGALLSPEFLTPGALLRTPQAEVAPDWVERLAWLETLETIPDWSDFSALFPEPATEAPDWAASLASDMLALRRSLQENGLTLNNAARLLSHSVESDRWQALSRLETRVENTLRNWEFDSRSRKLAGGITLPTEITRIVLAGVTELPPLAERALTDWNGPVTALVGAPAELAGLFSPSGRPLPEWTTRTLPWPEEPHGSVRLAADTRQQAVEALRALGEAKSPSTDVAIGSADTAAGEEITRSLTHSGWPAFHPAATATDSGVSRWLGVWSRWLAEPRLSVLADLLALPETGKLVGGRRAEKARSLARLRDEWMAIRPADLRHRMTNAGFRRDGEREAATAVLEAAESLERWRTDLLREDFLGTLRRLLEILANTSETAKPQATAMLEWLEAATPLIRRTNRGAAFWIELLRSEIPAPALQPPDDRVTDVQGWLELYFEPGRHLVLCGLNEGHVPARNPSDPWLGESAAQHLGLTGNPERAARDAFLFQAMIEARRTGGRCDLICAKTGGDGDTLLPSRLLLAADRAELPGRVSFLFRELEPPEAGLRWHADWTWKPRLVDPPERLATTSFASYLACPFRFYLSRCLRMNRPEPDRVEWNARDFGTVAHEVLERWGGDTEARAFNKTEAIHDWLSAELDRVTAEWFGKSPPLSIRLQTESLRRRFEWFARIQACSRADGWEIAVIEHPFEFAVGNTSLSGKIDRIDRHRDDGRQRVIDYKTGKVDKVESAHRKRIIASTVLPEHLKDSPAIHQAASGRKMADFVWTNLQLPLYSLAIRGDGGEIPHPAYFCIGATENEVELHEWTSFNETDLAAAADCATWVAEQVAAGAFWPPAEKVRYDDFTTLTSGRPINEMFTRPV